MHFLKSEELSKTNINDFIKKKHFKEKKKLYLIIDIII